ncbi:putative Ribonucloprotein [Seiridium cardinale]|uniref:H/ACA ribonucleoprotein complex subunit 2 n=1 Tax=Seiridium cardinale TaxID=138064 RepID=A0ABR2XE47_9PEZI
MAAHEAQNAAYAAWPLSDIRLTQEVLDLLQQGMRYRQVKKVTKALNRGVCEIAVLAADANPLAIVLHLPLLAEDRNALWVFVPSKIAIGRSCGIDRPVIAACINASEASDLAPQIQMLKDKIERLMI